MTIALVDDDPNFLAQTARTLALVLGERGMRADVSKFASAARLLAEMKGGKTFDMYFLDVMMPDMDGIELGRRLRRNQPDAPLVYFTTSREHALLAFGLEAADYVLKPFARVAFDRALDRALRRLATVRPPSWALKTDNGYVNVPLKDFVSVEAGGRYQVVNVIDGRSFVLQQSMYELWEKLQGDNRFLHVGRQCIVNLAHLTDFCEGVLTLAGGRKVVVPRRSRAEVKRAYLRFFSS